jgi:hypothetical protein
MTTLAPLPGKPAFSVSSPYWLGAKAIYLALRAKGASNPLAIGALSNADMESAFKPSANGDNHEAYSLWQWHWNPRGLRIWQNTQIDVKAETDIAKIVDALWWELSNVKPYVATLAQMRVEASAEVCAEIFCQYIEGAGAPDAKERRAMDAAWWTTAISIHSDFFKG